MTFATRRSLRRSQTIDHDELADTKIGFIEMLPSTQPKRRGRPPKSSTLCRKLPRSKPRGRSRRTAPLIMSDKRIALTLGWQMRKFTMGKRVGDAARSVYRLSRQWPWDLVAGFVPRKWSIPALENLRRLFRIIHQNFTVHDHRNDFQFVKDYLHECAMKHNRRRPHLKNSDIRGACDYFADDNPARRDVIRRTMTRLRCSISTVVPEDEDGWQDYRGYDHFDDDDDDDDEYVDIATPTKRSRTPSSPSLSPKRARTAESTEPRPQSITDITNSLQSLHAQKQKELEAVTNSLDEITASIQAKEASQTNHVNAKIDRLSSDVKAYESEREKILKIRGLVEQQHKGMKMKADHFLQQYTSRLEECDKLIAQANADVLEELDQMARRDFDLRDEKKRLEGRVNEVLEEVRHCSVIGTLMRLGPGGMAKLLGRLEGNGVELVGMVESIMNDTEE
ncbi:hypothetical protein FOYG_03706 [Fusarium oxysporum NRRL 32931]|uniref:Uncharacterized protein n=1 Tax=Fusarium oxysporum NRRL 32931 TaxID=660029 RepID=W9J2C1_FUSOX|nr:hypothetical protein FOYG_03706 [Fusarium oxysporum NRRL 32931]